MLGVELPVPGLEQRRRDVETLAVEAELEHLRSTIEPAAFDVHRLRLLVQLLVLDHAHLRVDHDRAAEEDLAGQPGIGSIGYVVLANVTVQPVGEVQVLVVEADEDVGDHA